MDGEALVSPTQYNGLTATTMPETWKILVVVYLFAEVVYFLGPPLLAIGYAIVQRLRGRKRVSRA